VCELRKIPFELDHVTEDVRTVREGDDDDHILKGEKEKTSCCSEWKDIYTIKSVKCNV